MCLLRVLFFFLFSIEEGRVQLVRSITVGLSYIPCANAYLVTSGSLVYITTYSKKCDPH